MSFNPYQTFRAVLPCIVLRQDAVTTHVYDLDPPGLSSWDTALYYDCFMTDSLRAVSASDFPQTNFYSPLLLTAQTFQKFEHVLAMVTTLLWLTEASLL